MWKKKAHLGIVGRAEPQIFNRRSRAPPPIHAREHRLYGAFDTDLCPHDRLPRRPDGPHRPHFRRIASQARPVISEAHLWSARLAAPRDIPPHRAHNGLQYRLKENFRLARRPHAPHERAHVIRESPAQPIRRVVPATHRVPRASYAAPVDQLCQRRHLRRQAHEQLGLLLNDPVHPWEKLRQVDIEDVQ